MKTGLWAVIVVVTGIVGFLLGYSVSSATGSKHALVKPGHAASTPVGAHEAQAGGYASDRPVKAAGY